VHFSNEWWSEPLISKKPLMPSGTPTVLKNYMSLVQGHPDFTKGHVRLARRNEKRLRALVPFYAHDGTSSLWCVRETDVDSDDPQAVVWTDLTDSQSPCDAPVSATLLMLAYFSVVYELPPKQCQGQVWGGGAVAYRDNSLFANIQREGFTEVGGLRVDALDAINSVVHLYSGSSALLSIEGSPGRPTYRGIAKTEEGWSRLCRIVTGFGWGSVYRRGPRGAWKSTGPQVC
jgi:hypothetical protein